MPPKKQEQEPSAPIVVWSVLPIVFNSPLAFESLKKPVNIKKTLDRVKIIELLKDKGIEKYLNQGSLTRQGELFLCENLQNTAQQFLAQSRKPADPKKDQKKDSKKDSKKEEVVVQESEKPIQFDFKKGVTEFLFYLDIPCDLEALEKSVKGGLKPEIVLWIQQQIKQGSQLPNYTLLNNERTVDDFMNQINSTSVQKAKELVVNQEYSVQKYEKKEVIRNIKQLRGKLNSELQNTIIIQMIFEKDLQHPENDTQQFLKKLFQTICSLTLEKQKYDIWLKDQKIVTMVPTIKQTIKKEVIVEQKKQDKKGGKKETGPPVTEIVEQVIEKKYQSFPENIKSDLTVYKRIAELRQTQGKNNVYFKFLQDLALSVSYSTEPLFKLPNLHQISQSIWNRQKNKPVTKVNIQNVKDKLRPVIHSFSTEQLHYSQKFQITPIPVEVSLYNIILHNSSDPNIKHQYKLNQFTQLSKMLGKRVFFSFQDRKFVEKLEPHIVNSLINQQLEFDPKIYYGESVEDNYHLLILSRVNPPGRVLYKNSIFDWKVIPNFQFWQETVKNKDSQGQFWDYNWRKAGNLKMLSKRMMPTDNSVIIQSSCCFGDKQTRFVTVVKENIIYGLRQIASDKHIFWKHTDDLRTTIFSNLDQPIANGQRQEIKICIQKKEYVIQFCPFITINWLQNKLEQSREFGPNGEITKRLANGNVQILYANGDTSFLSYGVWTHIKNNILYRANQQPKQLKRQCRVQTDKKIELRQDSTVTVTYSNGNKSVVFKDGTVFKRIGVKKIQILNPYNIIVRVIFAREKDYNVIGAGSAFAYLGQSNILERSYDGALYQLYDHSFSWHSYTQGIDRDGVLSLEKVKMIAYPDKSIIKVQNSSLTFLNRATQNSQQYLHERWIQLFTSPDYHREGVYDVDLIQGQIKTRDAQSNFFKVKVNGTGKTTIAVSFNVGNTRQQKNQQKNGFDIPQQNFFLPAPQNKTAPRLFVIYPDGSGEQYLTQDQISELKTWTTVNASFEDRIITQYSRELVSSEEYLSHKFSEKVALQNFQLPNILSQIGAKPNLIKYNYNPVQFRSIESISWDHSFSKLTSMKDSIKQKRAFVSKDLASLKTYKKA